jgi:hypothetical protein
VKLRQFIFSGDERFATSRVSLPGATSEQLPVDAAGFVQFRGNNVKTAESGNARPERDIRSAPRHVGSNGDISQPARLGDDERFAEILSGVKKLMSQIPLRQ